MSETHKINAVNVSTPEKIDENKYYENVEKCIKIKLWVWFVYEVTVLLVHLYAKDLHLCLPLKEWKWKVIRVNA